MDDIYLARRLLLENESYFKALHHKSIPIEELGFKEYSTSPKRNLFYPLSKSLKAVIPDDTQYLLHKSLDTTVKSLQKETLKPKTNRDFSKSPTGRHASGFLGNETKLKNSLRVQTKTKKKIKIRRNYFDGTPLYSEKTLRMKKMEEEEIAAAKKRIEDRRRWKRISSPQFHAIDAHGERIVYDYNGGRTTQDKVRPPAKRVVPESPRERVVLNESHTLLFRTSKFVETLRKKAEADSHSEQLEKEPHWRPHLYAATTLPVKEWHQRTRDPYSFSAFQEEKDAEEAESRRRSGKKSRRFRPRSAAQDPLPTQVLMPWPHFANMEEGDVVITVEYCCDCDDHAWITHHNEQRYLDLAQAVRDVLMQALKKFHVRLFCYLIPIDLMDPMEYSRRREDVGFAQSIAPLHIQSNPGVVFANQAHTNDPYSSNVLNLKNEDRIGAFEVQVALHQGQQTHCHLLHSKLYSGTWPHKNELISLAQLFLRHMQVSEQAMSATESLINAEQSRRNSSASRKKTKLPSSSSNSEMIISKVALFDNRLSAPPKAKSQSSSVQQQQPPSQQFPSEARPLHVPKNIPENPPPEKKLTPNKDTSVDFLIGSDKSDRPSSPPRIQATEHKDVSSKASAHSDSTIPTKHELNTDKSSGKSTSSHSAMPLAPELKPPAIQVNEDFHQEVSQSALPPSEKYPDSQEWAGNHISLTNSAGVGSEQSMDANTRNRMLRRSFADNYFKAMMDNLTLDLPDVKTPLSKKSLKIHDFDVGDVMLHSDDELAQFLQRNDTHATSAELLRLESQDSLEGNELFLDEDVKQALGLTSKMPHPHPKKPLGHKEEFSNKELSSFPFEDSNSAEYEEDHWEEDNQESSAS